MLLERREDFFRPFRELQREIDRLFEDFFSPSLRRRTELYTFTPDLDVYETDKELVIEAEIPGMDRKDITVKVEDNILKISGEKKLEREKKDRSYRVFERSYGRFERCLALPDYVDTEKIKAKYENGVLTITIPKREEAKAKVVDVEIE